MASSQNSRVKSGMQLKSINNFSDFEINPSEITFPDIIPNIVYQTIVLIRNLTKTPRRIRIFQPKSKNFRCDYDMQGVIAAGLSLKLIITFETLTSEDYHDSIMLTSDQNFKFEIRLHAITPAPELIFPTILNLGFCKLNLEREETMTFKNQGSRVAKIELKADQLKDLKIDPTFFQLLPDQTAFVKLFYTPRDSGVKRGLIEVTLEGSNLQKYIEISATSIEYSRFLTNEYGGKIESLDFGRMLYGEKKEIRAILVNNTPEKTYFRSKFRSGIIMEEVKERFLKLMKQLYKKGENATVLTPNQVGLEQMDRIISCFPPESYIEAYSQVSLIFRCKSKTNDKIIFETIKYTKTVDREPSIDQDFSYTGYFEFDHSPKDPITAYFTVKSTAPQLKFSLSEMDFKECAVNEEKHIMLDIENQMDDFTLDYYIEKIPPFYIKPFEGYLLPHQITSFLITYAPKTLGNYSETIPIFFLKRTYRIPLPVKGTSSRISDKIHKNRGPEGLPQDFQPEKQYVDIESNFQMRKRGDRLIISATDRSPDREKEINSKPKTADYLKKSRAERTQRAKTATLRSKLALLPPPPLSNEDAALPPPDYEFQYGLYPNLLEIKKLEIPIGQKDNLFVKKPIDKYEPVISMQSQQFNPDPCLKPKKKYPNEPKSHTEIRDVALELSGENLQKIYAGPTELNFGSMYVKSREKRTFWVRNDLRSSIKVRIIVDNDELRESDENAQVIPGGQMTGFEIVFSSKQSQGFKGMVKYVINEKHTFEFRVVAQVEYVKLELQFRMIEFSFPDDSLDMTKTQVMRIFNKGNAVGRFKWFLTEQKIFTIKPKEGEIPAKSHLDVSITYNPSGNAQNNRAEEEKLRFKVEDGNEELLRCVGIVKEAKCVCKQDVLNFGQIPVSKRAEGFVYLKNVCRNSVVFQINQEKLPHYLDITPMKDKMLPDETKVLKISFLSKSELKLESEVCINLRGGRSLSIPFKVETIIPKIIIKESLFDFGEVTTLGTSMPLTMTIVNESDIGTNLIVDLREKDDLPKEFEGIECLNIDLVEETNGNDMASCILPLDENHSEVLSENSQVKELNNDEEESEEEDELEYNKRKSLRFFQIIVKPLQTIKFLLRFTPKDIRKYLLELPIKLKGFGKLDSLSKQILCTGLKPRFLLQPQEIEFKKKIITTVEKCFPSVAELTISNPDSKKIYWKFDLPPQTSANENVFNVYPSEGYVEAGQSHIIKTGFNPLAPGEYEKIIPLFIDYNYNKPYLELRLKGSGANSKMMFDRREAILPPVPLNIRAKCIIQIINDGYENMGIKSYISPEFDALKLEAKFLDGQTLGITKQRLKVEISFISSKPLSFIARVDFSDENGRLYSLPVSGTTDNSVMTNYSYFQRNSDREYVIHNEEGKALTVSDAENIEDDDKSSKNMFGSRSLSVVSAKSSINLLGYQPIPKNLIERNANQIATWLNQFVLNIPIQSFPNDVINNDGGPIFDLIFYLTNRQLPLRGKFEQITKKSEKLPLLLKQYEDLLRYLKENGALLNNIRPQYLLSYSDYHTYITSQKNDYFSPNCLRLSESKFLYLSTDSWIALFYQIIKIYYLSRITLKVMKNMPGISSEKLVFPDYLDKSNFLSFSEYILLKWLEINLEIVYPSNVRKIANLTSDLKDCLFYSACIQNYVGTNSLKYLKNMKLNCLLEEDFRLNADKVLNSMKEIVLQTHFQINDLVFPSGRENFLFIMQLLNSLPHYVPKTAPIVFSCILGEEIIKNIELNNNTNKPISYWIKYEGSSDFSIEKDNVKLEIGTNIKFKVKFVSRVSAVQTGRITFTNKKETNAQAAALVFELESNITERKSIEEHKLQSKLYKFEELRLNVRNIFTTSLSEYADFQITIIPVKIAPPPPSSPKNKNRFSKRKKAENKSPAIVPNDPLQIPSFFVQKEKVRIKRGEIAPVYVQFLPFTLETHRCNIVFCDSNVGEFQYTLIGETLLPDPLKDDLKPGFKVIFDESQRFDIQMDFRNEMMQAARRQHEQRLSSSGRTKEKEAYFKMMQKYIPPESINFDVEIIPESPFITSPKIITLYDSKFSPNPSPKPSKKTDNAVMEMVPPLPSASSLDIPLNVMALSLLFKLIVKDYSFLLVLKSLDRSDVRVFKVILTVHPKAMRAQLELKVPAGDEIKQEIPLINNTDRDCNIKIVWNLAPELNGNFFSGPKDLVVRKKTKGVYPITFKPVSIGRAEGKLTLMNQYTNDILEFDLTGIGEEPLAKDHIILDCVARKATTHIIELSNTFRDKPINYIVETDLLNADGPPNFTIPPGKTFKYPLAVTPLLGGVYTGSITFYEEGEKNKYIWYTVVVNTDRPAKERMIELASTVRKATQFEIEIRNPLEEAVTYEVIIDGEFLMGNGKFEISPKSSKIYELLFVPLRVFRGKGSIAFINEKLGEIWYELSLIVDENQTIRSPTLKAELGKVEEWGVVLENPYGKECQITTNISNPFNFDVIPENIIIPAFNSVNVRIRYTPSDLDVNETGEIIFENPEIGRWKYLVYGIGLPPTKYLPRTVTGLLNKDQTGAINFKNPFKEAIQVHIFLNHTDEINKEVLNLLIKKPKVTIPGLSHFSIPFSFTPKEIAEYNSELIILMNEKIQWKYPIIGITETLALNKTFSFKTQARVPVSQKISIALQGLSRGIKDFTQEKFRFELMTEGHDLQNLIKKCFVIKEEKPFLEHAEDELVYGVNFSPMKPFKTSFELIIAKIGGGRWKFKIFLEATEPELDDIITIHSPLNKTTSVSFKLNNRFKYKANFNCFFTPDSDPEFSVMPRNGELEGIGREGRTFVVSFTPVEYGKERQARLVIETDELLWSYMIKGCFPVYRPPTVDKSRMETRMNGSNWRDLGEKRDKKNFMADNIKKTRIQSALNYKERVQSENKKENNE